MRAATWRALGTSVHLLVEGGDLRRAREAVSVVVDEVDRTYSRFRPDSELSLLNARPGRPVEVSPLLARAIEEALRGARLSGGLADPTVGGAMRLIGYDRDFDRLADLTKPLELRLQPIPGWQAVQFDARSRTVRLPSGVGLDLVAFQDHPYQPRFLDTWTLLSFVAARTRRVHLTTDVLNLPLRPPAVVARAVASNDMRMIRIRK